KWPQTNMIAQTEQPEFRPQAVRQQMPDRTADLDTYTRICCGHQHYKGNGIYTE
ncbi:hypothetical protein NPIL_617951, partial [Nephila pilipes]